MNDKIASLLNLQVNREFFSAYLYLDMANYYSDMSLDGFANWYMIQAQEERDHAMLFIQYMQNNGLKVTLEAIEKPSIIFADAQQPLVEAAKHERFITDSINNIYREAQDAHDYRTMKFLDWFIEEQGEEEKHADDMVAKFKLFGNDPKGLYMLNQENAARAYSAPSLVL